MEEEDCDVRVGVVAGDEEDGGCVKEKISHVVVAGEIRYEKGFCAQRSTDRCSSADQYRGQRNFTFKGEDCLMWSKRESGSGKGSSESESGAWEDNLCRIANGKKFPWCWTAASGDDAWSECFQDCDGVCVMEAQQCSWRYSDKCRYDTAYAGKQNRTITGKTCQAWSSQTPHSHSGFSTQDDNFCRSYGHPAPWCYTTDAGTRWQECFAACNGTCVDEKRGCAHRLTKTCMDKFESGTSKATTVSGRKCQAWDADEPHHPAAWGNVIGSHNFCRNQDSDSAPWCYTLDPTKEWEECYPACKEEQTYHDEGPYFKFGQDDTNHVIIHAARGSLTWQDALDECRNVYNGSLLHVQTAEEAKQLATRLFEKLGKMPTGSVYVSQSPRLGRGAPGGHRNRQAFWLQERIACPSDGASSELKNQLLGKAGGPCLALDMTPYLNKPKVRGWRFAACGPIRNLYFPDSERMLTIDNIRPIHGDSCIHVCTSHNEGSKNYDIAGYLSLSLSDSPFLYTIIALCSHDGESELQPHGNVFVWDEESDQSGDVPRGEDRGELRLPVPGQPSALLRISDVGECGVCVDEGGGGAVVHGAHHAPRQRGAAAGLLPRRRRLLHSTRGRVRRLPVRRESGGRLLSAHGIQ